MVMPNATSADVMFDAIAQSDRSSFWRSAALSFVQAGSSAAAATEQADALLAEYDSRSVKMGKHIFGVRKDKP